MWIYYSHAMQFNPPLAKEKSIIADIDFLLFGTSEEFNSEYSLADRTRNVNLSYDDVVVELFKADPNFMWDDTTNSDFPCATTDLVSGQDHYIIPDGSMVINRVRIKDRSGKWKTLTPVQRRELSDSELASTGEPQYYYKIDNALFPVPVPTYGADEGLELEFQRGGNHFSTTDTTASPGFDSKFHQALSVGASLRYAMANGLREKVSFLTAEKERIRVAIQEHYQRRAPDRKPSIQLKNKNIRNYGLN